MFDDEDLETVVNDEANHSYSNCDVGDDCHSSDFSFSSISSILPLLSSTPRHLSSAVEDEASTEYIPSPEISLISDYNVNNISSSSTPVASAVTTVQPITSHPEIPSVWCGFTIVGDNIDKTVRQRHQLIDRTTQSLHYFNSYAVRDRVDFSSLDDRCPDVSVDNITAECLLPSQKDMQDMLSNFEILLSRILTKHMPPLRRYSDVVVQHITHCHYTEMSKTSDIVS